jgi:NitT/TauT family transport system substrate-binding protein
MYRKNSHSAFVLVATLAAALLFSANARSDEPVKIRAGWVVTPASLIPILFAKKGLSKHEGKSYDFEPVFVGASPPMITGLAAGDLEIAALGFSSFPFAVQNAGLSDLRIIADETQNGYPGYATTLYMVLKNSPFKSAEDLKDKTLAVNALGAGVDIGMRAFLLKHGMQYQRDYNLVEVPFPSMKAMLMDGKVSLITGAVPFMYDPELQANARTLFTLTDALGGTELSFWTMRAGFIAKHRAAVVDLLEDTVRAYRWYADPANHDEAVDIVARQTKLPREKLDAWVFTAKDNYRDPNGVPDLAELQRNIDAEKQLGFIKTDLEVAKYADLSLVKEADQRLK